MRRAICWTDKLEDGVKREVRVHFWADQIKWQFKRSDAESWDYDSPPSELDWDTLENRVLAQCHRAAGASFKELELLKKKRAGSS